VPAALAGPQIEDAVRALDAGRTAEVRPYLEQSAGARCVPTKLKHAHPKA